MRTASIGVSSDGKHSYCSGGGKGPFRHLLRICSLMSLLAAASAIVYFTGGTAYAYAYVILIPVLLAAAWYNFSGGLLGACAAGLVMATMPLNVATGAFQETSNWLVRLGLYLILGGYAGWLFGLARTSFTAREKALRTDPGSGLPNQFALIETLTKSLGGASRSNPSVSVFVVRLVDITDVLEAMGVDASDELLCAVGCRILKGVPKVSRAFRLGDAELVLTARTTDAGDIDRIADQVVEVGEENLTIRGVPMRAQLVVGSSSATCSHSKPEDLVSEARIAMFAAAEQHKSYLTFTPVFKRRSVQAIALISRVRRALELGEFELHYQPKIGLSDGSVRGGEGLIRWRATDGRFILPGAFMPKVENTSLISLVTRFVATEACRFTRESSQAVSINFSVRNLFDDDLLVMLKSLIDDCGLDPRLLEIEITESALMQDIESAKKAIECIRSFGVGVSIDDFGTGFASFGYLKQLPITGLKIDRAFVIDLEQNERSRKLMGCMVDVGHALGLGVTAEGVETGGQRNVLRELGCDYVQGFLYSPAMPSDDYMRWCRRYAELLRA